MKIISHRLEDYFDNRFTSFLKIKFKEESKPQTPAQQKIMDARGLEYISSKKSEGWTRKVAAKEIGVSPDSITLFLKNDTNWKKL